MTVKLPSSHLSPSFATVVIDPPWNERGAGKCKRGADKHYPLLKTPDILRVIIKCPYWAEMHPKAHLYLWTTNNHLKDALWLMEALDFQYITNMSWIKMKNGKLQQGLGQYFRGSHELCLFGVRKGEGRNTENRTEHKSIPSVIIGERTKHSAKPPASYDLIAKRSCGPYLELFSRKKRPNWTCWGNELE
jgi:N6-adenosine-specific RNA methylase IME4